MSILGQREAVPSQEGAKHPEVPTTSGILLAEGKLLSPLRPLLPGKYLRFLKSLVFNRFQKEMY